METLMGQNVYLVGNIIKLLNILIECFYGFGVVYYYIFNIFYAIAVKKIKASLFHLPQFLMKENSPKENSGRKYGQNSNDYEQLLSA
jgi:hypothetical protein